MKTIVISTFHTIEDGLRRTIAEIEEFEPTDEESELLHNSILRQMNEAATGLRMLGKWHLQQPVPEKRWKKK